MRITLVSAHYPPNFVSGGTLQPQRLAQGLRDRGHDVRVYAGLPRRQRRPLDTWDEVDETGLPVHWVVTTPWIDWADEHNYDNAAVAEHFAAHLDRAPGRHRAPARAPDASASGSWRRPADPGPRRS